MTNQSIIRIGAVGSLVTALCCFTPVLVIVLGSLGLAGAVAYLDVVLLPLLALFLAVTVLALIKRRRSRD